MNFHVTIYHRPTKRGLIITAPALRMKMLRDRPRVRGLREIRIVIPDARSRAVRQHIANQVARLLPDREAETMRWIEAASEFDVLGKPSDDAAG
jgi:hypothetical protein